MPATRRSPWGPFAIVAAAGLWGTWPLYVATGGLPLATLTLSAMALPALVTWRELRGADRGALLALALVGLFDAANAALFFLALERGPVVAALLTHYLAPVVVALTAPVVLGEPRSPRVLPGLAVTLLGLALVLGAPDGGAGRAALTAALGAGSALFYGGLVVASQRAARHFSPWAVLSLHSVLSVGLLLGLGGAAARPSEAALLGAPALGALLNGLGGGLLFNWGLTRSPTEVASVLTYVEPVVAVAVGAVFLAQPVGAWQLVGGALVLGASWAVATAPRAR